VIWYVRKDRSYDDDDVYLMATLTVVNISGVLKTAKDKAYSNLAKRIAAQKSANLRTRGWAAMLISNGSGTSGALSFMNSANRQHTSGYVGKQAYRDEIRAIMMIGPFNNHTGEVSYSLSLW
jgi:hypothetical protein